MEEVKEYLEKTSNYFVVNQSSHTQLKLRYKCNLFDEIMVSTDDEKIAEVSIKHGAKVPFFRSMKNADDFTRPGDVIYEVLNEYNKIGIVFLITYVVFMRQPH